MASFLMSGLSFNPSDKDLIQIYLYNKVIEQPLKNDFISECDLYGEENPWDIWNRYREKVFVTKEGEDLYFFTRLKKKTPNAKKFVRKIGSGRWEGEGKTNILDNNGQCIGIMRRFRFEKCEGMHDGAWIMHEYSFPENSGFQNDYVVCRIRKNPRVFKRHNDQMHTVRQMRVENTISEEMQVKKSRKRNFTRMQIEPTNSQQIQTENMNSEQMMTELQPLPQTLEEIQQMYLLDFEKWELEEQVDNIRNNRESKEQQMWPLDYENCLLDGNIYSEEKLVDNTENNTELKEDYKEFLEQECATNYQIHTGRQMRVENTNSEQMQIRNNSMASKRQKISNIAWYFDSQSYVNSLEQMQIEPTNSQQIQTESMNSEQMMTELQPLPQTLEEIQQMRLLFYEKELEEDVNIYSEEKQLDNIRNNPELQMWLLDYEKYLVDGDIYLEEKRVDNTGNNAETEELQMRLLDYKKWPLEEQDENICSEEKQVDNTRNNTESKEECATNEEVQKTWNDIQGYIPYTDKFIVYEEKKHV